MPGGPTDAGQLAELQSCSELPAASCAGASATSYSRAELLGGP